MYAQGTKQYEESQKRINEIQRQAAEQAKAVAQSRVEAERQARIQIIALEEQTTQQAEQLGIITHQQALTEQASFESKRYAISYEALQERQRAAELDPDRNVGELERIHREIEQLEQQHQLKLGQIKGQLQLDATKYQRGAVEGIATGFEGVITRIGTSIKSLQDLFKASINVIVQVGMQMLGNMAAEWISDQLKVLVFGKAAALSSIAEKAGQAGAGGVASMAAAPWPLNMSAPIFGAEMAAAAMAFAPMASAAGGYDIPGSINPLVQTHAREMVLPAKYADVIRQQADGGGGGGGLTVHNHVTIATPMDGRTRNQLLADMATATQRAMARNR
jgi:hypothetical protein